VAHPNCQQLLASVWYEGLLGFRRRPEAFKAMLTASVFFLSPALSFVYLVAPHSQIGDFMKRPFIKFITHVASYMTFLCEFAMTSINNSDYKLVYSLP
jgi:transient receptor potential cation channel subfamily C protein 4